MENCVDCSELSPASIFPDIDATLDEFLLPRETNHRLEETYKRKRRNLEILPSGSSAAGDVRSSDILSPPASCSFDEAPTNLSSCSVEPRASTKHSQKRSTEFFFPNTIAAAERPTHVLPRKLLLRWDYLRDRVMKEENNYYSLPEVTDEERQELSALENLAAEKRAAKREKQRQRDAEKRAKLRHLCERASAGDQIACQESEAIFERRRLKNARSSSKRKRQREDELFLESGARSLLQPVNFSVLLKQLLAAQSAFTGKLNPDFKSRLCQAASETYIVKNGVQQKFIIADVCIVDPHDSKAVPLLHPSTELTSNHVTAVVERYNQGSLSVIVRRLYLPSQDDRELSALDNFMKSNDPFIEIPAKRLFQTATASRPFEAAGFSTYNLNICPCSRKVRSAQGVSIGSDVSSANLSVNAMKLPNRKDCELETFFKVGKNQMILAVTSRQFLLHEVDDAVFYGVECMEVWYRCAPFIEEVGATSNWTRGTSIRYESSRMAGASSHEKSDLVEADDSDLSNAAKFRDLIQASIKNSNSGNQGDLTLRI